MLFDRQSAHSREQACLFPTKILTKCPYCAGKNFVKCGQRKKKHELVQMYFCKHCQKKFTASITKNKTFPLRLILDSITSYNRLNSLEESAQKISEKYGIKISFQNIANWLKNFSEYLPFARMREFIAQNYNKRDVFVESKMLHGQIYDFKYHRAKTDLILSEDFKNYRFKPLREFLELVVAECPHQVFQKSQKRASEFKNIFNLDQVKITRRDNMAVKNTNFVMQAVVNNKLRHEILQQFMLVNDSVTIATEVPILLDREDLLHYKNALNFDLPLDLQDAEAITGHIDFIQIRNGAIYILDYKPSAKKEKPIEQLTIYALALARLTSLRLFHFKCAWFDEEDYFEFFPLHVVYKKKRKKSTV
jgi:ATP-dependent exoDNAse (exonuclease V) beta subunit